MLLGILIWREWEIRKVEERVVKDYADLNVKLPIQWQDLANSINKSGSETQILLDRNMQQELERIRRKHGYKYDRERGTQFRPIVDSSNI